MNPKPGKDGWLCPRGDQPLELVEAVRPPVPVKRTTRLGLERALSEVNLGRFTEIPKRQRDQCLYVVGIGILPAERAGEAGGWIDFSELPGQIEGVALRRLHLDPVALSDAGLELQARGGE